VSRARLARPTDAPPVAHASLAAGEPAGTPADISAASPVANVPVHVAVIMDGNRRWARAQGRTDLDGHAAGVEKIRFLIEHSLRRGVRYLSLYAFSRENWARPDDQVMGLFQLLDEAIRSETPRLIREGVEVRLLGRLAELPADLRASVSEALAATAGGDRLVLAVAFNYAGRTEIVDAVRALVAEGLAGAAIDEAAIAARLYTAGMPDPDLVIRTGGEQRLSNFLIWQSAYAEFWTCDVLWPDFDGATYDAAIEAYARRSRRYGT
jgi:undecaprenyl diphosphate synthase